MRGYELLLHAVGNLFFVALCENRLGRNAVDANPKLPDLRREVLRHHLTAGLRRRIRHW